MLIQYSIDDFFSFYIFSLFSSFCVRVSKTLIFLPLQFTHAFLPYMAYPLGEWFFIQSGLSYSRKGGRSPTQIYCVH